MAAQVIQGVQLHPVCPNGAEAIASKTSTTVVLNTNALQKTGASGSGADSQLNPFGVTGATSTNHANVCIVAVPDGANYLDLALEYTGSNPTVTCKVRVFGATHSRDNGSTTDMAHKIWPADFDSAYFNPGDSATTSDWKPLGDLRNVNFLIELDNAADRVTLDNGTSKRSTIKTVNIAGCSHVMVLVDTAATVSTKALVIGWFGC